MLGSLILYLKGMRIMMFQLSGFYFKLIRPRLILLAASATWEFSKIGDPNIP